MLLITIRDLLIPPSILNLLSDAAAADGTGAGRPEPYSTSTSTANKAAVNRQSSVGHHLQVRIVAALVPRQRPANRSKCGMHWMPRVGECAAVRSHGASWIIRVLA